MTKYTNSPLVDVVLLSPNYSAGRINKTLNPDGVIDKITIHHMAGNLSIETCGRVFKSRKASANYGVGTDGRIGMYVEEKNRAWTSSSKANDIRAVTIEVANDGGPKTNWHVSDTAIAATIKLCIDICKRNSIKEINFTGNSKGNLTMHRYFIATTCPGGYLKSKFQYIADQINLGLNATPSPDIPEDEEEKKEEITVSKIAGKKIVLEDCNLYSSSSSVRRSGTISGKYYVWSDEIIKDRIRITNSEKRVGVKGQVTGWINYSAVKDQIEDDKPETPPEESPVTPATPAVPEVIENVDEWMWDFLKGKDLNDFAVAGIMGNLFAESGLKSTNLQNSYEDDLSYNDETYTSAVDTGVYTNFVNDKAGYGFAQWTFWSRKEGLLNFAKSVGKSIGSPSMQMDFFWKELNERYPAVLTSLKSASSVRDASNVMLKKYEAPADQSESVQDRRAQYSQKYFDKFASFKEEDSTGSGGKNDEETFTPYTVNVKVSNLSIRKGPGATYASRGYTGKGVFTIVDEFNGWGLLKTYQKGRDGWISLDLAKKSGTATTTPSTPSTSNIVKGDTVKIISSTKKWATGQNIPNWVKMRKLYVRSNPSSRGTCQVSTLKIGAITGVIEVKYLKKV